VSFDLAAIGGGHARAASFCEALLARAKEVAGVRDAAVVQYLTPSPGGSSWSFADGDLGLSGIGEIEFDVNAAGAGFFRTLGIPLVRGREFTEIETLSPRDPRVVIVNQSLAVRLWGDADPIGQKIRAQGAQGPEFEVVGVVADAKYRSLREAPKLCLYRAAPLLESPELTMIVRMEPGAPSPLPVLRAASHELEPRAASYDGRSLEQHLNDQLQTPRLTATLFVVAGIMTLILAASGLFALVSSAVAGRRREIGIRLALGAKPAQVVRLVTIQGLQLAAIGGAIGVAAALASSRFVSGMLYGVSPQDPIVYGAILAALAIAVIAATVLPARAATRLEPATVLRDE
jgi:hypothetical protein